MRRESASSLLIESCLFRTSGASGMGLTHAHRSAMQADACCWLGHGSKTVDFG